MLPWEAMSQRFLLQLMASISGFALHCHAMIKSLAAGTTLVQAYTTRFEGEGLRVLD